MGKEQFIGTWRLVSFEARGPDGEMTYHMGQNPGGVLMYDANGKMAVQFMKSDRPAFASGDRLNATSDEIQSAYAGYGAYYGSYEVNDAEKIVTRHVEGGLNPNVAGRAQQRSFEFSGNRFVSNQQKWDTLGAERSGAGWRSGELPEGPVVASSPFGGLSLHLLPAL